MTVAKPSDITRKLMEPFPVDVIEEKNGLLYIPHEIIRDRLISATENQFDWSVDQVLFRVVPHVVAHLNAEKSRLAVEVSQPHDVALELERVEQVLADRGHERQKAEQPAKADHPPAGGEGDLLGLPR